MEKILYIVLKLVTLSFPNSPIDSHIKNIISGNDEGFFKINNNGEIRVEDGGSISYENYKEFILIIEVSDGSLKENIQVIINIVELPPLSFENFRNEKINIYPNPFLESLIINTKDELKDIKIYDLEGKISYSNDWLIGENMINFFDQSDGVYILTFRVDKEKVKIRIIKKGQ